MHCKGLCRKHYGRLQRNGDPQKVHHRVRPRKAGPGEGWCAKCSAFKPAEQFSKDSKRSDGLKTWCRECCSRIWASTYDSERDWERRLKSKYGINAAQYKEMLASQGGVCATCGETDGDRRLSVDHCHASGKVRGLLCFRCNSTLGKIEESFELISSIVSYLEKHSG